VARRFPIRFKLAAALAVPMLALLFVAGSKILQTRETANEANEQAELALSATGPGSLLRALQNERNHTAAYLTATEPMVNIEQGAYLDDRPITDQALEEFRTIVDDAGGQIEIAYRPALDRINEIEELRGTVDGFTGTRDLQNSEMMQQVFDGFSSLITSLFDANRQVSLAVNDPDLRRGAALINLSTRQSDTVALLTREVVFSAVAGDADGINTPPEISRVAQLLNQLRRNEATIRENAVGDYRTYVEQLFAAEHTQQFPQTIETALQNGTVAIGDVLGNAGDREAFGYDSLLEAADRELQSQARDLKSDAGRTETLYTAFGVLMLLLAAAMTWLVSRSITKPLRSLTVQATSMANDRLPSAVLDILDTPLGEDVAVPQMDPIVIRTSDEVADVAAALNTVQDSALELAVEQAVLRRNIADSFVNLGRRNQNLLSRQLDFITELERDETDPDSLSSLFRLDHLATRMRRNAESLLVLAGIEPPRKWAAPVRITDVIRAALSEIEDYQRVSVVSVEPAAVVGSAAADLAHLLAELIENAVTFSPPDQSVEVRGRSVATGYTLAIVDSGFGMPPDEIERANRRLAGAESFTIAPSKYLGHYVTGNLATRHGIAVQLHNSFGNDGIAGGITATIDLPPALLTAEPAPVPDVPPARDREPVGAGAGRGRPSQAAAALASGRPIPPQPLLPPSPVTPLAPGGGAPASPGTLPPAPAPLPAAAGWDAPATPGGSGGPAMPAAPAASGSPLSLPQFPPVSGAVEPLVHRVRGAQLPSTQPVRLQRGEDGSSQSPPPPPQQQPQGRPQQQRSIWTNEETTGAPDGPQAADRSGGDDVQSPADDVYSFLSNFRAGVQRGLDDTHDDPPPNGRR
jgi:signal transduction histidine kinase